MPLPDWVFDNFLFQPWPGRWLAADSFRRFTLAFSIGLSLTTSGLFVLEQRARRLGYRLPERWCRALCISISALAFLVYFDFFNPNTRYHHYYHRHELYHYYLGAKYFDELGYKRLYACTAIAEVELGHGAQIRRASMRDLSGGNVIVPIAESYVFSAPERCKSHFSAPRWQAFKADVAWFERVSRGAYWDKMREDHGYNPPPVWTMTGKLFASLSPAGDHFFKLLALIDVALQLGNLILLGRAFGFRVMTLGAVFWGCNGAANSTWTCGAFLRQDWLFLLVLALCLARKRRFFLSGAALAWSSLLRIFPIFAFAGALIIIAAGVVKKRSLHADHRRFLLGAAFSGLVLVGAGALVAGPRSYVDFADHIRSHKNTPLTNNMGLGMMLTHDWSGRMAFTRDERLDDSMQPWKQSRAERTTRLAPVRALASLAVFAWMIWALRRIQLLWVGMAASLPLMMSALDLTCYYYAIFIAFSVLVRASPALGPAYLALAAGSQILLTRFHWIDDRYVALSYLFYTFALCALYALSRPLISRAGASRLETKS